MNGAAEEVSFRPLLRWLWICLIGLLVTGTAALLAERIDSRVPSSLFNLDAEASLPTTYSVLLWAAASMAFVALAVLARESPGTARAYAAFAAAFGFFAFDEGSSIHEQLNVVVEQATGGADFPTFYWVPVGVFLVLLFGVVLLRLVRRLQPAMRRRLVAAGVLFVLGALVVESLGAPYHPTDGLDPASLAAQEGQPQGVVYTLFVTVEEGLEMAGALLALRAGLLALSLRTAGRSLILQPAAGDDTGRSTERLA